MMDADTLDATGELADAMAAATFVDPKSIPTRFSLLKTMSLSPAHYLWQCQQPQDDSLAHRLGVAAMDRKDALRFGSAVHAQLFGTGAVHVYRGGKRAGKRWDEFVAQAAVDGVEHILNEREADLANRIVDALRSHPVARRLLLEEPTHVEDRIDWTWMGKACRSTPDARNAAKGWIADLKTTVSAHPGAFVRQGERLHYHCQAAFYDRALGGTIGDAYIIAVEKTRPHPVTVLRFAEETLELGAKQVRLWFERLLQCEAADEWPAYMADGAIGDFEIVQRDSPFSVEIDGEKVEVG